MSVFVIDADRESTAQVQRLIEATLGLRWAGSHPPSPEAVRAADASAADVVIVDPPAKDAMDFIRSLCFCGFRAAVVLHSPEIGWDRFDAAVSLGVQGFVSKRSPPQALITAVLGVAEGHLVIGPNVRNAMPK